MKKVLINRGSINPTTELACKFITFIMVYCGCNVRSKTITEMCVEDLDWCDILIDIRPYNGFNKFSKALKKTGRIYIVFLDDDLLGFNDIYVGYNYDLKKCLKRADALWCTNPDLLKCYSKCFNIPSPILMDYVIKPEEILKPAKLKETLRFVYAAGADHEKPFEKYVEPALSNIVRKYGGGRCL